MGTLLRSCARGKRSSQIAAYLLCVGGYVVVQGTFLAGMLTTMVLVDVTKLMVGRLRPVFIEVCQVNTSLCFTDHQRCDVDDACMQSDDAQLRWARYVAVRATQFQGRGQDITFGGGQGSYRQ